VVDEQSVIPDIWDNDPSYRRRYPMNYLKAQQLIREGTDGPKMSVRYCMSGFSDTLLIFCRAQGIERGIELELDALDFGTLSYYLRAQKQDSMEEVFLLFPWDLLPELDWRTGFPETTKSLEEYLEAARHVSDILMARSGASFIYCSAPIPNLSTNMSENQTLEYHLCGLAGMLPNVAFLSGQHFSLENYLSFGAPIRNKSAGNVAEVVCDVIGAGRKPSAKVLVSDLDNVMWRGVIGEDGYEGIEFRSEGVGYKHFVFQSYLKNLKRNGVLLAAVSRNDEELAVLPFSKGEMVLGQDDFVRIIGSYEAKSAQIRQLSEVLNLHASSFVFVDDNPIEIAEVRSALPEVNCVRFSDEADQLAEILTELGRHFHRTEITEEDGRRTEYYRSRLLSMPPSTAKGSDITDFLRDLKMKLKVRECSEKDSVRAVQLINKTTQFNLHGNSLSPKELNELFAKGARLYTSALSDRHGDHGEILAFILNPADKVITHFVMSCRVFQRRVENAFLVWISRRYSDSFRLDYRKTNRNEPFRVFMESVANSKTERIEFSKLENALGADFELFEIDDGSDGE